MADRASLDTNRNASLLAVSNADATTPVILEADPVTHRLLVDASVTIAANSSINVNQIGGNAVASGNGTTTACTTYAVTSGTSAFANELLLGGIAADSNAPAYTGDAAWTNLLNQGGFDLYTSADTQYQLTSATGAYSWTLTNASSRQASQAIVGFKSATQPTSTAVYRKAMMGVGL